MKLATIYRTHLAHHPFAVFQREVDRLLNSPARPEPAGNEDEFAFAPPLDITEDSNAIVVSVELPGVNRSDVQITLDDGILQISGERKQPALTEGNEWLRRERIPGRFQRLVELPKTVDASAVKAAYQDGVLSVTLPKTPDAKPRQIEIAGN